MTTQIVRTLDEFALPGLVRKFARPGGVAGVCCPVARGPELRASEAPDAAPACGRSSSERRWHGPNYRRRTARGKAESRWLGSEIRPAAPVQAVVKPLSS